jgi:hypothetical protein
MLPQTILLVVSIDRFAGEKPAIGGKKSPRSAAKSACITSFHPFTMHEVDAIIS